MVGNKDLQLKQILHSKQCWHFTYLEHNICTLWSANSTSHAHTHAHSYIHNLFPRRSQKSHFSPLQGHERQHTDRSSANGWIALLFVLVLALLPLFIYIVRYCCCRYGCWRFCAVVTLIAVIVIVGALDSLPELLLWPHTAASKSSVRPHGNQVALSYAPMLPWLFR